MGTYQVEVTMWGKSFYTIKANSQKEAENEARKRIFDEGGEECGISSVDSYCEEG